MSLRHSILAVLLDRERTGYELSRKVDTSLGFFWPATHQQIYRELNQLDEDHLIQHRIVKQDDKPDKKIYRLTLNGKKELQAWILTPLDLTPPKDPFLIKLFAGGLVGPKPLLVELRQLRKAHEEKYKKYLEIEQKHFTPIKKAQLTLKYQYLTLRKGILFEKTWLSWANEVEASLE